MSIQRRVRAMCAECEGFEGSRELDCWAPACPFYDLRPGNDLPPVPWWDLPMQQWKAAAEQARLHGTIPAPRPRTEAEVEAARKGAATFARARSRGSKNGDSEPVGVE